MDTIIELAELKKEMATLSGTNPLHYIPRPAIPVWVAVLSLLSFSIGLRAQFSDFNDNTDTGWTHYDPLGGLGAGAKAVWTVSGGSYRIQALASPSPASAGPGRAASLRNDVTYTDFYASVDLVGWNNSLNQAVGILGRIRETGLGTTDGYAFTYQVTSHDIRINKIVNEAAVGISTTVALTLDPAQHYRLVFTGLGSQMVGRIYALTNLATPLATVTATPDSTYPNGVAGLLVFDNSSAKTGTADATFDNYLAVVEEPRLSVQLASGHARVSWPVNSDILGLQRTASLNPPIVWEDITNGISSASGRNQYDETPAGGKVFRLKR